MLTLMILAVVSVNADSVVAHPSSIYFDDARCTTEASLRWLPDDELRQSWGSRPKGYGKWGYTANVPPYIPPYQTTGHPADVFDGDSTSGFVWKTVTLSNEECPSDNSNCHILTINGDEIAAYNQKQGGRRCYGCQGVSTCSGVEMSAHPLCSTAVCEYCENLNAYMMFDTVTPALVQTIGITVQNERRSPRVINVYYSRDSISGPFYLFRTYTMTSLVPGEVTFEAEDHQSVLARYWKIEIESNWGDPNYVELLELKFYGQVLSKTVNVKWVDSESSCNSVALSTSVLDFGFATTSENLRALERGEFKLRVNRKEFGPYTVLTSAKQIRDDMHEGGLTITVSKYSLVEGTKTGQGFRVSFFDIINTPEVLTRSSATLITGLTQFPAGTYTLNKFTSAATPEAYCYDSGKAIVTSTFASIPASGRAVLCQNNVMTTRTETVYGVSSVTPAHGPIGGNVTLTFTGSIAENVELMVVDSSVSSSEDCQTATSVLSDESFHIENNSVTMTINAQEGVSGARFCMLYDNGISAVIPSAYFDIEEPVIESVSTASCGYAAVGMKTVTVTGSGLGLGDQIFFANGNCEEKGKIAGVGVVTAMDHNVYTLNTTFTSTGLYHVIGMFGGLCRVFTDKVVTVFEVTPTTDRLLEDKPQTLTITGTHFTSRDRIAFAKEGKALDVESSIHSVSSNGDRIVYDFRVKSPAEEGAFHLLYYMDVCQQPFDLDQIFHFYTVSSLRTVVGSSVTEFSTAIINTSTSFSLYGLGLSEVDRAYFVNGEKVVAPVTFEETTATKRTGSVTFTAIGDYSLVYAFGDGEEITYSFIVSVSSIASVEASSESTEPSVEVPIAVKDMLTIVEYHGHGIHDDEREKAYYKLTPNSDLTGGNSPADAKYCSGRAVASHGPYVTVDDSDSPMDMVFAFENGGRSSELNHWIIYDLKNVTTLHQFGMYVNSVFFPQLPRDFEVQRLVSCYDDSCLFDETSAKLEAPWQTVLSVKDMPRDNSQAGKFLYWNLDRDVTARYFRLYITKNWGSTVFTSVIQVDFIGAKADYDNKNRARWISTGATCNTDNYISVSARGHSTISTFPSAGMKDLCFDFSNARTRSGPNED